MVATLFWFLVTVLGTYSQDLLVEIFQIDPVLKIPSTPDNAVLDYEWNTNSVQLPSGFRCEYHQGSCRDQDKHAYHWEVKDNPRDIETFCKSVSSSVFSAVYNSSEKTVILLEPQLPAVTLLLTEEGEICGRNVWLTNRNDLFVVSMINRNGILRESLRKVDKKRSEELDAIQHILEELQKENAQLKKELISIKNEYNNGNRLRTKRYITSTCKDYYFFPFESIFVVVVTGVYLISSVINIVTNYFSLRMLKDRKHNCVIFYCLSQGLTTRYICRTQSTTKMKVDKWLLDIETPFK